MSKTEAETTKVTAPSGQEFTIRPVNPRSYIYAGQLPLSICAKLAEAEEKGQDQSEAFAGLSVKEQFDAMRFMQLLVKKMVVSPRIVEEASGPDEIDALDEQDFAFLVQIAMGGEEAVKLATFRGK